MRLKAPRSFFVQTTGPKRVAQVLKETIDTVQYTLALEWIAACFPLTYPGMQSDPTKVTSEKEHDTLRSAHSMAGWEQLSSKGTTY